MTILKRQRISPSEILREEFLKPLGLTHRQLADHLGCAANAIRGIANGRTSITPEMASKLSAAFQTSPEFWLNAERLGGRQDAGAPREPFG
jgi:antitoxin HigA-1